MVTTIEIVELASDTPTRGKAYGTARSKQIGACMADWLGSLRTAGIAEPESYVAQFLRDTDFKAAIQEHTPDLLEEVQGIASGAGQPFELMFAQQLMDEEWAYRPGFLGRLQALQKCSSVAIRSPDGRTWIGQNMDLGGYTDGHQVLWRMAPQAREHGALILTIGGMIGLLGVNARGVGVCVNSLPQLPSAREGLPVAFVIRRLLQAATVAQAVELIKTIPHATGQHYVIADPNSIRSFEASAAGVAEYRPPDATRVLHTNHPLAGNEQGGKAAEHGVNSIARLESLTARLMHANADLQAIKAALSAADDPEHPVCRVPRPHAPVSPTTGMIGFTTGSMISTLAAGAPTIDSWVSRGPPSLRGYTHVKLQAAGSGA